MTTLIRAGIYARISSDEDDDRLGVTRQIRDCAAEATRRGWQVEDTYTDNDVSATRAKIRPAYQRMLADIDAGRITGLIVWDVDRLTRTPRELEDIIDLADRRGLSLASIGGEIDLATPQGRMTARIKGTVARHEAEQMSRRLRRKFDEKAEAGSPHGAPAYGYRRVDGRDVLDDAEANTVREAARRALAGESLRGIAADFNRRDVPVPRRGRWSSTTLRQLLIRDRNAGLRRHRGKVVGTAAWPPIYDTATHDRVISLLTDPNRRTQRGSERKHLLSGLARCGRDGCDGTVVRNVGRKIGPADGKRQPPAYVCSTCYRVRRKVEDVERVVEGVIVERLRQPDVISRLIAGDPAEVDRLTAEVDALEARLNRAADDYADGELTAEQLRRITSRVRPQIEDARARRATAAPSTMLDGLAGAQAAERWAAAPLEVKRAVIDLLVTVTIMPSGPGKPFDPALIHVEWNSA